MAVSKRLRFEVLQRDGHRCTYCVRTAIRQLQTEAAALMRESDEPQPNGPAHGGGNVAA